MPKYTISIEDDGEATVTMLDRDGNPQPYRSDHPNFQLIVGAVLSGKDPSEFVSTGPSIVELSERVSIDGDTLLFDGQPVHDNVARTIMRYHAEGRDPSNLVKFMELLAENPSFTCRNKFFDWTETRKLTVDEDGFVIGYKGVDTGPDSWAFQSHSAGRALVDGVEYTGYIPQNVGSVVSMPRATVDDNAMAACSEGLHVGDYRYAKTFASILLEVRFSPADVVAVADHDKIRVCRYEVLGVHVAETPAFNKDYEPTPVVEEAFVEVLEEAEVPKGFIDRLRSRIRESRFWGDEG